MFSEYILPAFVIAALSIMVVGDDAISMSPEGILGNTAEIAKQELSEEEELKRISERNTACFPRYKDSSFMMGKYCVTKINIGPVLVEKSLYKVSNKEHCSFLINKKVKEAMAGETYQKCQNGEIL